MLDEGLHESLWKVLARFFLSLRCLLLVVDLDVVEEVLLLEMHGFEVCGKIFGNCEFFLQLFRCLALLAMLGCPKGATESAGNVCCIFII
jgi:hypothetical protein